MLVLVVFEDAGAARAYNAARAPISEDSFCMLAPKQFDDLAQRLSGSLPKGLQALQEDISRNLRAALEGGLAKLDLVTREEFDVQTAVLARTREKLERLELLVAEIEQRLVAEGTGPQKPSTGRKTSTKTS
jgi:hypothetical protein